MKKKKPHGQIWLEDSGTEDSCGLEVVSCGCKKRRDECEKAAIFIYLEIMKQCCNCRKK